jgi:hypothetical protein
MVHQEIACGFRLSTNDSVIMYLSYKRRSKTLGQNVSRQNNVWMTSGKLQSGKSRTKANKIFATGFRLQCRLRDQVSDRSCRRAHYPGTDQQSERDKTRLYRRCDSLMRCMPRRRSGECAWGCLKGQINEHSDIDGGSKC